MGIWRVLIGKKRLPRSPPHLPGWRRCLTGRHRSPLEPLPMLPPAFRQERVLVLTYGGGGLFIHHSNIPSSANSMSPVTPPNYEDNSAKIVSPTGSNTMQISGDNVSPPYHHVHARKSSSPIPTHTESQISIDTKHTSPKKTTSHQHAAPAKPNTVYAFAHPCVW